jgi:hypothetical protein
MSSLSARATCADCGKTFAVPDPARTYKCKACGGRVVVARAGCTACGAVLGEGEAFCAACGAAQNEEAALGREKDVALDAEERRQASLELVRALGAVRLLRIVFGLGIFVNGARTMLLLLGLSKPEGPRGPLLLMLGLVTGLLVTQVVGFRQARVQPFLWAVVAASLATVNLAVQLLGADVRWQALVLPGLFVVLLWCLVPPTARVRRLLAEHPDLYAAHKLHGTEKRRHASRGAPERSLEQFEQAKARTARASLLWAAAIVLAVGLAAFASWSSGERRRIEPLVIAFEQAWAAGDSAALAELAPSGQAAARRALLDAMVEAHGWGARWPSLGEAGIERGETQAQVAWPLGDDSVVSNWTFGDGSWRLSALRLPLPPLDGPVERLVAAWNARDVAALAALYPPDKRDSASASIARVVERRAWGEDWPELLDAEAAPRRESGATVTFRVAGDRLVTRWDFREEHGWCLTSLNLPD